MGGLAKVLYGFPDEGRVVRDTGSVGFRVRHGISVLYRLSESLGLSGHYDGSGTEHTGELLLHISEYATGLDRGPPKLLGRAFQILAFTKEQANEAEFVILQLTLHAQASREPGQRHYDRSPCVVRRALQRLGDLGDGVLASAHHPEI